MAARPLFTLLAEMPLSSLSVLHHKAKRVPFRDALESSAPEPLEQNAR